MTDMFTHVLKNLPKKTFEILVTIPREDINREYELSFNNLLKEFTYPGFRKGNVPKKIAEKEIKKETVYDGLLRKFLPDLYQEILKKLSLKPVVQPRVEILKAKDNEDWQIKITIAEKPDLILGDYKDSIKKAKEKSLKSDIWLPGKSDKQPKVEEKTEKSKNMNEILTTLINSVKCEISDLIIEDEINRRLAKMVDDIQKVGLTVEKYLATSGLTMEQLKKRLSDEISDTYKIEFILAEIADKENIKVETADLDKIFANIKDEKEKNAAKSNAYLYASILRKQKTLEYLTSL